MQFLLSTPEDNKKLLSNATKVKIHLTTGIVEILEKHQNLLGRVSLDLLEIESNQENKRENLKFLLQEGLVIVSSKGLTLNSTAGIYIYAKRVTELNSSLLSDEFLQKIEQKYIKLEIEKQTLLNTSNLKENVGPIKIRISMLEADLAFDKKILFWIKESKN